jgi:aspartate/methionine/tyrosine aminotransferase
VFFADRTNWNFAPNRLSEALNRQRARGERLLDLISANPTICGFDYHRAAVLSALSNAAALTYEPDPKGLESPRRAVAAYYAARGKELMLTDVVLTASTSEAYSYIFRTICNPGDEVLIPAPSYPLFGFLADIHDVKLVRYALVYDYGWQIDFHALEQAIRPRTRAVIVVNPNNPTGHFVKASEVLKLNEICRAQDMAVVADEVFLDFALGEKAVSFAGNSEVLTFTMSGLSKISGLPQMKLAWLITSGPQGLKGLALARLELIADTYLSVSTPVQLATPSLLELRHGFQEQLMARVRRNLAELDRQLASQTSCSRLHMEGGWYAVLRVPATRPDEELALELLESKKVYVHPGHFYDFPGDGYLVVSLILPQEQLAEGITGLLSIL